MDDPCAKYPGPPDAGIPDYYCWVCGVPLSQPSLLDQIFRLTDRALAVRPMQPKFHMLTRERGTPKVPSWSGHLELCFVLPYPAQTDFNEESGQATVNVPGGRRETFRLYESNQNRLDGNENEVDYAYPLHMFCVDAFKKLTTITGRSKKLLAPNPLGFGPDRFNAKLGRMLRRLEDDEYGCRLELRKHNTSISKQKGRKATAKKMKDFGYFYGGAEHYVGRGCRWEQWDNSARKRPRPYSSLPLGWKYFVNPDLFTPYMVAPSIQKYERNYDSEIEDINRSNLPDDMKRKLLNECHAESLEFYTNENRRQHSSQFKLLFEDAMEWKSARQTEDSDVQVLKQAMSSCFLNPRKVLCHDSVIPLARPIDSTHLRKLPQEILLQILQYLPTPSVICALEGSIRGSIMPPKLPSKFWRTRFGPGFEMYILVPEIDEIVAQLQLPGSANMDIKPIDFRTLYHYLGTISDLKSDIKDQGADEPEEPVYWEPDAIDPDDSIFFPDPTEDPLPFLDPRKMFTGWQRKDIRTACLSNRKRIYKCIENFLEMYDGFSD